MSAGWYRTSFRPNTMPTRRNSRRTSRGLSPSLAPTSSAERRRSSSIAGRAGGTTGALRATATPISGRMTKQFQRARIVGPELAAVRINRFRAETPGDQLPDLGDQRPVGDGQERRDGPALRLAQLEVQRRVLHGSPQIR